MDSRLGCPRSAAPPEAPLAQLFPCKALLSMRSYPESSVSRTGSALARKYNSAPGPAIFSATIFYNRRCVGIVS